MLIRRSSAASPRRAVYRALRLRGLREHPDAFTSSYEEDRAQPAEVAKSAWPASTPFWGAFRRGAVWPASSGWSARRGQEPHKATLVGMYVAPEYAGQGVGRALLQALLAQRARRKAGVAGADRHRRQPQARASTSARAFRSFGIEPDAIRVAAAPYAKNHMHLTWAPHHEHSPIFPSPPPSSSAPAPARRWPSTCWSRGCKRPLIVTDKALGALPVLAEFQSHLQGLDVAVFSGVFGNPDLPAR
jgi:GNAT superfamily N-acetyltransferase